MPSRQEWSEFIEQEIERRDRRHSFLWGLLASSLAPIFYFGSQLFWNFPQGYSIEFLILSVGAAGALNILIFSPIVDRLVTKAQPRQTARSFDMLQSYVIIQYTHARGVPRTSRLQHLPRMASWIMVAAALAMSIMHSFYVPISVPFFILSIWTAVQYLYLVLPTKRFFRDILFTVALIGGQGPGGVRSWRDWAFYRFLRDKFLSDSPRATTRATIYWSDWLFKHRDLSTAIRFSVIAVMAIYILSAGIAILNVRTIPDRGLASMIDAILFVMSALFFNQLLIALAPDRSGVLLEQLRYAVFLDGIDIELVSFTYEAIEQLQRSSYHESISLAEVLDALEAWTTVKTIYEDAKSVSQSQRVGCFV